VTLPGQRTELVESQGRDERIDGPRFQRWLEALLEAGE
jgi:hypothetical protein